MSWPLVPASPLDSGFRRNDEVGGRSDLVDRDCQALAMLLVPALLRLEAVFWQRQRRIGRIDNAFAGYVGSVVETQR